MGAPALQQEEADLIAYERQAVARGYHMRDGRVVLGSLRVFVELGWSSVDPAPFIADEHVTKVCTQLERLARGEMPVLVLNTPPGTSKSLLCSTLFPAWYWLTRPTHPMISASFEMRLGRRDAMRHRNLLATEWWRQRWPHITVPWQNTRSGTDFQNTLGGYRYVTSTHSAPTGRHANLVIIDDPLNPLDAYGRRAVLRTELDSSVEWLHSVMMPRLHPGAGILLVMQRLHESDLSAELLRVPGAVHLRLPMRAEARGVPCPVLADHECVPDDRAEGALLCPMRIDEVEVARREQTYGPQAAASQLQQRPSPIGGAVFKREWFAHRYRRGDLPRPDQGTWAMAWDLAFKGAATSDFVAGAIGCLCQGKLYIACILRGRWGFEETCRQIEGAVTTWPQAWSKVVEDAANGPAVVEVLEKRILGLRLVKPEGGKEARWHSTEPFWAAGNVLLPEDGESDWDVAGFVEEACAAGAGGANDDRIDAVTHLIRDLCGVDLSAYADYVRELTS